MESDTNLKEIISPKETRIRLGFSCISRNPLWYVTFVSQGRASGLV